MATNYKLLPLKAHFCFMMAFFGASMPYIPVLGKQLGVSPFVQGCINAILPTVYLFIKPALGYMVDKFPARRQLFFLGLLLALGISYATLYFVPRSEKPLLPDSFESENFESLMDCDSMGMNVFNGCNNSGLVTNCRISCPTSKSLSQVYFFNSHVAKLRANNSCLLSPQNFEYSANDSNCRVFCEKVQNESYCLYTSLVFWIFVIFIVAGDVIYNICNTITDATCFDLLGKEKQNLYGQQRLWGSIGNGIAALLAGLAIDWWSGDSEIKSYTPSLILVVFFTILDLISCTKLKIPRSIETKTTMKDVYNLVKQKPIVVFLCFAIASRILDVFIYHYSFWYLEDLAAETGHMSQIKLIEGIWTCAQTLGGELIFFSFSGVIIDRLGYGYTMILSFLSYSLKLFLISVVSNPWYVIPVDSLMQGMSYALSYATIAEFANVIAPPNSSGTLQGVVTGIADGIGGCLGNLIGGILFESFGSKTGVRICSGFALFATVMNLIMHWAYMKKFEDSKIRNTSDPSLKPIEEKNISLPKITKT